jgi:hypothetical protein
VLVLPNSVITFNFHCVERNNHPLLGEKSPHLVDYLFGNLKDLIILPRQKLIKMLIKIESKLNAPPDH